VAVVEKPVTGSVDDLAAMIAARDAGNGRVAVAFQDIYSDSTLQLKQLLVDGAIGTPRSATVHACWPRGSAYYGRNNWAGKLQVRGTWVLDSPANNAIAHYMNLALFLLGQSQREMARPDSVTAELYRVNEIENYDTCSMRITCNGGVPLLVHFTHACGTEVRPQIVIHGSKGTLKYEANGQATIGERVVSLRGEEVRQQMVGRLAGWIRGDASIVPVSLEMSGVHLSIINGASEASPIHTIGPFEQKPVGEDDMIRVLPGIEALFARASAEQKMLSELGDVPWAVAGQTKDLRNYTHFAGPAR
jgi:predicted dehydrogenase